MTDLNEILVFARVVATGSFTAAAAALRMPKSTVSRKVSDLEARLGARLLNRTTRKLSLTDEGRTYYEHCVRVESAIEDAERAVSNLQETPRGTLRVTTGNKVGFLGPIITDYLQRNPEVRIEVLCTGRTGDFMGGGLQGATRAGPRAASPLTPRTLGNGRWFLV